MAEEEKVAVEEKKAEKPVRRRRRVKKAEKPLPAARPVKKYTFEQWATARRVKKSHFGGMKAFVKNARRLRTFEEWDACFVGY